MGLRDRSTPELIMLLLACVVAFVVAAISVLSVLVVLYQPTADLNRIVGALGRVTASLVSGLIGYVAGRGLRPSDDQ